VLNSNQPSEKQCYYSGEMWFVCQCYWDVACVSVL